MKKKTPAPTPVPMKIKPEPKEIRVPAEKIRTSHCRLIDLFAAEIDKLGIPIQRSKKYGLDLANEEPEAEKFLRIRTALQVAGFEEIQQIDDKVSRDIIFNLL